MHEIPPEDQQKAVGYLQAVIPLLHWWARLAWWAISCMLYSCVRLLMVFLSLSPKVHLQGLGKLASREETSSLVPAWLLSILQANYVGFSNRVLLSSSHGQPRVVSVAGLFWEPEVSLTNCPSLALAFSFKAHGFLGATLPTHVGHFHSTPCKLVLKAMDSIRLLHTIWIVANHLPAPISLPVSCPLPSSCFTNSPIHLNLISGSKKVRAFLPFPLECY